MKNSQKQRLISIGTQVLVGTVWLLLFATLLVADADYVGYINAAALALFTFLGYLLLRSMRREAEQQREIGILFRDLERANLRLRELDKMKTEFVSIASHQMRSPLTAIRGYADVILDKTLGEVPPKIAEAIRTIREAALIMIQSVDDFLDITRIEQGGMEYSMADFDLCSMLRNIVAEQHAQIEQKHLKLDLSLPESGACDIQADATKIKHALNNIIDNAVKYTPEGHIRIALERDEEAGVARITVSDTGIGLTPEAKRNLFGKFNRATNAKKMNTSGTGLGLYVAKQMVEAHHGRIWAESAGEGEGSTFVVELPL